MSAGRTITAGELAARLAAPLEGDGSRPLRTIEPLETAGVDSLSWLGSAKYLAALEKTRAGAVLVTPGINVPSGVTAIRVDDPDLALCEALRALGEPPPIVPLGVHPSAVVEPGARIDGAAIGPSVFVATGASVGPGTQLHAGVYVGPQAQIGRDCVLWPNVVVRERVQIGDRVIVHANSTIGSDGFGYLFRKGAHLKIPQIGAVVIEADVEIGANVAIDRARSGVTRIGRGAKIDNLVQIAHNCEIGPDCVVVAQSGVSGSSKLGRGVVLAGQVGLADHVNIGDGAVVTAQSGVMGDLAGGKTYGGSPAREQRTFFREVALVARLPELQRLVRELTKRVEELESAAHDSERDRT